VPCSWWRWLACCAWSCTCPEWQDVPGERGKAVLMAQLEFDNEEAMNKAFASPERAAAREDFKRFMTFEGTVTHQAMRSEEVWP
jgi:uncharacterized protein (TIGR02118 family)